MTHVYLLTWAVPSMLYVHLHFLSFTGVNSRYAHVWGSVITLDLLDNV